jgi:uncharacterized membrane protein
MQKRIIAFMKFLYFLADSFINTFGITRPTEKARKQAAFFILGLILTALSAATLAGILVHTAMH